MGVEEEFLLIDPQSGEPIARNKQVAAHAAEHGVDLQLELTSCQVETTTDVMDTSAALRRELTRLRQTATEAAAVGCALVVLLALVHHRLTWAVLRESVASAVRTSSMLLTIFLGAKLMGIYLANAGIPAALARQVAAPVLWLDCMRALLAKSTGVVEVGPAKTLAGFFKGIGHPIETVTDAASAARVLRA